MSETTPTQELDARRLTGAQLTGRAAAALRSLASGDVLKVVATDPGSVKDFEAFSKQTGNELMEAKEEGGKFHFLIKKA